MTKNNLPVKKFEQVETQIQYSTKIAKQVLKSQLQEKLVKAKEANKKAEQDFKEHSTFWEKHTKEYLENESNLHIKNNNELTKLRNLINKFKNDTFLSNLDMVNSYVINKKLFKISYSCTKFKKQYKQIKSEEYIKVITNLKIILPYSEKDKYNFSKVNSYLHYEVKVPLSSEILKALDTNLKLYSKEKETIETVLKIKKQIENIDQVIEQMEAQLLVNELSNSEKGKQVLDVTSDLVSQMLGEKPSIFKLDNNEN